MGGNKRPGYIYVFMVPSWHRYTLRVTVPLWRESTYHRWIPQKVSDMLLWYLFVDRLYKLLTHWGRVTHICVGKLTIIGSDNGLSPERRQAIIWTNAGILFIGPLRTTFSEILIEVLTFSFKKMRLKVSSGKWRPFCLGLNVLKTKIDLTVVSDAVTLMWHHCEIRSPTAIDLFSSPHYSDVTWALWRPQTPATRMFVQAHVEANNKVIIEVSV